MAKNAEQTPQGDLDSALRSLSDISVQQPGWNDHEQFSAEIRVKENDRGVAILMATAVEDALQNAIMQRMNLSTNGKRELFDSRGSLLSDFGAKILCAHRLGIFGSDTRNNLNIIRAIRNAFAHAGMPIKFNTPEVAKITHFLAIPEMIDRNPPSLSGFKLTNQIKTPDPSTHREKYLTVCTITAHNLIIVSLGGITKIEREALKVRIEPYLEIWAIPAPLP